ncbi:MAG: F0F1 ATP synthase subunit delta [Armatimonadota bacterium]
MRQTTLARRYAGALFGLARDADAIDRVESDLGLVNYSVESMPSLREVVMHPLIPADRKKEILAAVFAEKIEGLTLDFLKLLVDKRREGILSDVEEEYVRIADDFRGVMPAVVVSVVPLTAEEQAALKQKLGGLTGKTVELTLEQDEALIGGLVVKIGDTVIDGSVRGQLATMREKLLGRE